MERNNLGQFTSGERPERRTGIYRDCDFCKKTYYVIACRIGKSQYCGNKCSNHKGLQKNTGKTHFKKGITPHNWKGDSVGYSGLHKWVAKYLGKPNECEFCGASEGRFEWANKSGLYLRELTDWLRLCKSCHNDYDQIYSKVWAARRSHV